jgi:uncharacterized membrane protein YczE
MKQFVLQQRVHLMLYISGFLTAAFGVFLMKSSTLGLGPWGVAAFELSRLMKPLVPFFTFGLAASVHTYLMIGIVLLSKRNLKSLFVFVSVLLINGTVDLYDLVIFPDWVIQNLSQAILSHGVGFIAYCLGSAFLMLSGYPGLVIEELTYVLMKFFRQKNYPFMRTMVAYFGFILAIAYGFLSGTNANSITWLSLILGVAFGPVIGWMVKVIKQLLLPTQLSQKVESH